MWLLNIIKIRPYHKKTTVDQKKSLTAMLLSLYAALLFLQIFPVPHKNLRKMAIYFQNGHYFVYFINWDITMVMVNVKIYCMNHHKMLLSETVTYDAVLKIYREQTKFQLGQRCSWTSHTVTYTTLQVVHGCQIMGLYIHLNTVL